MKNYQFPISNCQLLISRGGFARGGEDWREFAGFLLQLQEPVCINQLRLGNHFQPKLDFIGSFFGDTYSGNEFRTRPRFTRRSIVGSRGSDTRNLVGEHTTFYVWRKLFGHVQDTKSKLLGPFFQLFGGHP